MPALVYLAIVSKPIFVGIVKLISYLPTLRLGYISDAEGWNEVNDMWISPYVKPVKFVPAYRHVDTLWGELLQEFQGFPPRTGLISFIDIIPIKYIHLKVVCQVNAWFVRLAVRFKVSFLLTAWRSHNNRCYPYHMIGRYFTRQNSRADPWSNKKSNTIFRIFGEKNPADRSIR